MNRRDFLRSGLCVAGSLLIPGTALSSNLAPQGGEDFWLQPRRLRLVNANTRENIDEIYWRDGNLNWEGYAKLCRFMRDWRMNLAVQMDPKLFDMLTAVQAWLAYSGYRNPLVITSGYRSPQTNSRLEGAARNSLHMRGMAVDFNMPGVSPTTLGLLTAHFKGGGVGFYPDSGFVHMDTGSVRYWHGKTKKKK